MKNGYFYWLYNKQGKTDSLTNENLNYGVQNPDECMNLQLYPNGLLNFFQSSTKEPVNQINRKFWFDRFNHEEDISWNNWGLWGIYKVIGAYRTRRYASGMEENEELRNGIVTTHKITYLSSTRGSCLQ